MTVSTSAPFPKLSALATDSGSEAVLELLSLTGRPDIISFAGGLPSPKGFPIAAVKEAADYVMDKAPVRCNTLRPRAFRSCVRLWHKWKPNTVFRPQPTRFRL